MSYEQYATKQHETPYIFKLEQHNQILFYFGANHSCDPDDPQYPILERFWQEFLEKIQDTRCVVLVEGNIRKLAATKEEAITTAGGEGGYITFLAHQQDIPVACPEPRKSELIKELLNEFSVEAIAYADFAQAALSACRRHQAQKTFKVKTSLIDHLADFSLFFSTCFYERQFNLKTIDQMHHTLFDHDLDLSDEAFFATITDPVADHCVINQICRKKSMLRDRAVVNYIQKLVAQQKNIFIVYGATHAIMQEEALKSIHRTIIARKEN
jgi:hypothetical protein